MQPPPSSALKRGSSNIGVGACIALRVRSSYAAKLTRNEMSTWRSAPIAPPSTSSRARLAAGWCSTWKASTATRPQSSEARWIAIASAALHAIGFSISTCLPARSACTAIAAWCELGEATYTASMSGSASSSS